MRFLAWPLLALLVLLPILAWWRLSPRRRRASVFYSRVPPPEGLTSRAARARHLPFFVAIAALCLLIVAAARPQFGFTKEEIRTEGIDIVLALDISGSMKAVDFKPKNRLHVAKMVAGEFIRGRRNDRLGLVIFSAKAFTQCPLTVEYGVLLDLLDGVDFGMIEDGTAIGMAIGTAVNRLRESESKSKVIVLLTDGRNNMGEIDPITAAELAKTMAVKIYCIGAGKKGEALYPVEDEFFGTRFAKMAVDIDDETLTRVAEITGGKYFRATDAQKLEEIYREISEMETTIIETNIYKQYSEGFVSFLTAGILLLCVSVLLECTKLRVFP
jgi:Ca-activated chloride channel family protein